MAKRLKLGIGESVVAVVPMRCAGPGWANQPVFIYIRSRTGNIREECLQPEEITARMSALFNPGAAMCAALVDALETNREV